LQEERALILIDHASLIISLTLFNFSIFHDIGAVVYLNTTSNVTTVIKGDGIYNSKKQTLLSMLSASLMQVYGLDGLDYSSPLITSLSLLLLHHS